MIWTVLALAAALVAVTVPTQVPTTQVPIPSTQVPTTPDPDVVADCFPSDCMLPDCFCSENGTQIPGNLLPKDTPHMIILAFSGALDDLNGKQFEYLLNDTSDTIRNNPNGCPIKATFFVPHEDTSYYYVQKLYGQGHEIAMQTITNRKPERFWSTASTDDWVEEVVGMKEMLHTFANISRDDLLGVRAPFLKPGGDNMMSMIYDYGLKYDSSLAAPLSNVPLWPYTMDYQIPHKCISDSCPSKSYPGIWEFPLNIMKMYDGSFGACALMDDCLFPYDAQTILEFLDNNFQRHYYANKAPFLLNLDVNWVRDEVKISALYVFIEIVLESYPDVWFVTMQQALQWMRNPVPSALAQNFEGWKCPKIRQPGCDIPRTCKLKMAYGEQRYFRYIQLCGSCPEKYPWTDNIRGTIDGKKVQNFIQKSV